MSLPTPTLAGRNEEGGAILLGEGCAVLDGFRYQENRYCERCGGWEIVIFAWEFAGGRLGCCLGCGRPVPEPFTRSNSEAA